MFITAHIPWIVRKGGQMNSKRDKQDRRSQRTRRLVSTASQSTLTAKLTADTVDNSRL
jgi:hypothetical protein